MTERQMRWEAEKERYNAALKTNVVNYLGCTVSYKNISGYGRFYVQTPWDSHIDGNEYTSIIKAKAAIKEVAVKYASK
ncbi:hypothetical protein WMW72_12055 [Paenibacillus filicis]|uniref:Uncharacterized protein n=1 Tax=Paenibacillus filicis TaxID=669464 RepID=A0ABU9DKM5_9BACL